VLGEAFQVQRALRPARVFIDVVEAARRVRVDVLGLVQPLLRHLEVARLRRGGGLVSRSISLQTQVWLHTKNSDVRPHVT
jgi:hypothetical protein